MIASLTPLRRFALRPRMRLRTLLLLVAILAVPCAWIGSQVKLVRDRATMIAQVENARGMLLPAKNERISGITIEPGEQLAPVSFVRRWLGDRDIGEIAIPHDFPSSAEVRLLQLFPGTSVVRLFPPGSGPDSAPKARPPRG